MTLWCSTRRGALTSWQTPCHYDSEVVPTLLAISSMQFGIFTTTQQEVYNNMALCALQAKIITLKSLIIFDPVSMSWSLRRPY
ncbi:hypothetical protein E2562_018642 [Oryza meyeriana var. granulata]|uniref:Uncharacterized protein n=1 Tax=Oryza meyeriana var. granulata TaxID=110450 RepID=A0A6G1BXX0_9ORYZ|nr:hypothetical protein E2562_018642 [Oryza meyeriana var. granulata]